MSKFKRTKPPNIKKEKTNLLFLSILGSSKVRKSEKKRRKLELSNFKVIS
jgi:hypothetical protein